MAYKLLITDNAQLLRDFEFQIINPAEPLKENLYMLFLVWDMWMRVTERRSEES